MLRVLFIIIAILYCVSPVDVMLGPIDDTLVVFLVLSLIKATGGYADSDYDYTDYDEIGYESEEY